MIKLNKIYQGDVVEVLKTWPDEFIDCVVTSPPYWGLRDYGMDGQVGLEKDPKEFVERLVIVFREVRRVLKHNGTLWLNLGDSYCASKTGSGSDHTIGIGGGRRTQMENSKRPDKFGDGLKPKDLCLIPARVALALQADGWYLRSDIIWHKPNPMPESVNDRPTKSHEYIFLLTKSPEYFYDAEAIKEKSICFDTDARAGTGNIRYNNGKRTGEEGKGQGAFVTINETRNKRTVWTVPTAGYAKAHFATFPPDLIKPCILAGCPRGGAVYDPFMGSGTTAAVARDLGRNYLGTELNPEYIKLAEQRLEQMTFVEYLDQ